MAVSVTRPVAQGYGALIGDDYYRLVPKNVAPINIYTRDSLAPRQQQSPGSQGDNVLAIGQAFGRRNLTGGEGLDWYPRPAGEPEQEFDIIRFWASANMDIRRPKSGDPYKVTLVKDLASWWTPTKTPVDMMASRNNVYIAAEDTIYRQADWGTTAAEETDTISDDIVMMDVGIDDTVVVVTDIGDVFIKPDIATAYVKVYDASAEDTPQCQAAWWIKGRIIAACQDTAIPGSGVMLEIAPGAAGTTSTPTVDPVISVVDNFSGYMLSAVDAGHAIVCGFSDGSLRSYVPQTDSAGIVPVLTIRGQTKLARREVPLTLGWNLGQLLVITLDQAPTGGNVKLRLYTATVQDERFDYAVGGDMQLIRQWDGVGESAPDYTKQITTSRDEAFFMVGESASVWNVWRFDQVTQGIFRHMACEQSSAAGLTLFDGRLALINSGDIILESATDFVSDGWLITPNITFGLNTPISWSYFVLEALNLDATGVKVDLYYTTDTEAILDPDGAGWTLVRSFFDVAQSGVELSKTGVSSNTLAMMIRIYPSSDLLTAPEVERFAVRGLPEHRDWVVELPINISDDISVPGRMPLRVASYGDTIHTQLLNLQGKSRLCEVFDPPVTLDGQIESLAEVVNFQTDRGSQGKFCMVRILGKLSEATAGVQSQGDEGMGIGTMGIMTMGTGEE